MRSGGFNLSSVYGKLTLMKVLFGNEYNRNGSACFSKNRFSMRNLEGGASFFLQNLKV